MSCQYGGEPTPNARIDAGLLYGSDLGVPQGYTTGTVNQYLNNVHSPIEVSGNSAEINLQQLVAQVTGHIVPYFRPEYNINVIHAEDIITFCENQPTIDDIPASLINYPGVDAAGFRAACLLALQQRYADNCQCRLPPQTPACLDPILAGRGQCDCIVYEWQVKIFYDAPYGVGRVERVLTGSSYGAINFRFQYLNKNPGDDYRRLIFQSQSKGDAYREPGSPWNNWSSPCAAEAAYGDRTQAAFFYENRNDTPRYEIIYLRPSHMPDSFLDNCCVTEPRDPIEQPTDPTANDGNSITNEGRDNVTIIIVPGFCNPSACTTLPGTPGTPGERGLQGTPGAQGTPGTQGLQGIPGLDGVPGQAGTEGTQGLQGIPGLDGVPGTTGAAGAAGEKGEKGDKGARSTIALGAVKTVGMHEDAKATLVSGGESDPIYDLEIPDSMDIVDATVKKWVCDNNAIGTLVDVIVPVVATRARTSASLYIILFAELAKVLANIGCAVVQKQPTTISNGFSTLRNRVVYCPCPEGAKSVILRLVGDLPPELSIYYTGNETTTKFGNICLSVNGHCADADQGWIWTRETLYRIPQTKVGDKRIRIFLQPGLQYSLQDTGER